MIKIDRISQEIKKHALTERAFFILGFVDTLLAFGYIVGGRGRACAEESVFSNAALTVGAS